MYIGDAKTKYFWIHINPPYANEKQGWDTLGSQVEEFCYDFTSSLKDFDEDMLSTRFNFYIEKEIQFFKQRDFFSTSTYLGIPKNVQLNVNIDYKSFDKSSDEDKFNILANGILYLLKFWKKNLKIPKNIKLAELINLYEIYLYENLKITEREYKDDIYIKSKGLFRIEFDNHLLKNISEKEILIDFEALSNFLNNKLHNISYGKSIKKIYFSYDLFNFYLSENKNCIDNKKKYLFGKDKNLSIMEQFDTNYILYQERNEQFEYFREGILNAILRIKEMQRKPKFFDVDKLHMDLNLLLDEYIG